MCTDLSGGGFQFGGASAFGATNNSSGVFTFGAGSTASPAPPANQSGAPGGGFNFAQPPVFNMGYVTLHVTNPAGKEDQTSMYFDLHPEISV